MIAPQTVSTSRHLPSVVGRPGASRQRALVARAGTAEGVVDDVANGIANIAQSSAAQLKQALAAAEKASGVAADAYGKISPAIEKATKAVSPIVNDAVEASKPLASSLATEVTKASSSAASSVVTGATAALKDAGVSPTAIKSVESAATGAYSTAKPVVTSFLDFVTTTDPVTLVEYSAAAAAFVLAFPSIASFVARALRGYAGATSPAIVLDRLSTGSSVALVDIRSQQSKEAEGIPDLRDKSKYIQLEAAVVDDGRVRRELKNIGSLEVTMTAMQVAALKKISKKTELYIMVGIDLDPDLDRLTLTLTRATRFVRSPGQERILGQWSRRGGRRQGLFKNVCRQGRLCGMEARAAADPHGRVGGSRGGRRAVCRAVWVYEEGDWRGKHREEGAARTQGQGAAARQLVVSSESSLIFIQFTLDLSQMSKSCKGILKDFVHCVRESACFAVEHKDISVCSKEADECTALRQAYATCKRGQLDPRTRIKGNKGY